MRSRGRHSRGFSLLEALLAAAILAIFALPVLSAFSRAAEQGRPRTDQFDKFEFAVSILEERVALRDFSAETGVYENRFSFEVTAVPYQPETITRFDDLISFTELTVRADMIDDAGDPVEISQIVARKAPD